MSFSPAFVCRSTGTLRPSSVVIVPHACVTCTCSAANTIQSHVRAWLAKRWYFTYVRAVARIQRWARSRSRIRTWRRLRSGVRALHTLARGFIVRVHVARILSSASLLQRAIRLFLVRNRAFKVRDGAVRRIQVCAGRRPAYLHSYAGLATHLPVAVWCGVTSQAVWKGFRFRVNNEDMLDVRAPLVLFCRFPLTV